MIKISNLENKSLRRLKRCTQCCILIGLLTASSHLQASQDNRLARIQAVTLDARQKPTSTMLPALKQLGVTHITLTQFGFQRNLDTPKILMNPDAKWYSESDQGARAFAHTADSLGLNIILKPHLWIGRYSAEGQSRHEVGYMQEEQWRAWEADYTAFLMHYAHLAEEIQADLLVIGTELARSAHERPQYWRQLIEQIRSVYRGRLTYAANWWEEYEQIEFWDLLDFIGVQAYFELTDEPNPGTTVLAQGWAPYIETLENLSVRMNRPVLFTEIGYRNVSDAAARPWRWPARTESDDAPRDDDLQVRLYTVFFEELWDQPWFHGAVIWKWHGDRDQRRISSLGFTPQGKPAEQVINEAFNSDG